MLKSVDIVNFRNFKKKTIDFPGKVTVVVGPNASGKTNILESLYLLSTGKSFRARVIEEMVNYDLDIARVAGRVNDFRLEVVITRGENGWPKKKFLVNGVGKRLIDFAGNFKAVLFGPWDMGLVTESPSTRRHFLDIVLSQVDREYRRAAVSYEKGLRQRNRVLWQIREDISISSGRLGQERLLFWDKLLVKNGDYISAKREEFIAFANNTGSLNDQEFEIMYDKSAISEARLKQYAEKEVAAATTLVGPHRDDMLFRVRNVKSKTRRDLAIYGSRGEQRMGVLWLKMAELAFIQEKIGEKPTLLLDDIFSELDHEHRSIVMDIAKAGQTIITTADKHHISGLKIANVIKL